MTSNNKSTSLSTVKKEVVVKLEPPEEEEDENDIYDQEGDEGGNYNNVPSVFGELQLQVPVVSLKASLNNSQSQKSTSSDSGNSAAPIIQLGQTFRSFAEVSEAIKSYEARRKVNLAQKYYRRIAANPKPSNKEDYSLTVEERKRFVFRWVDFCCTYFDALQARPSDLEGDGAPPPGISFTVKECPMRIRFQTRFKEKDLFVSIFRENHDHTHDSPLPIPNRSRCSDPSIALNNQGSPLKPNLRPPPSLAPLPNCATRANNNVPKQLESRRLSNPSSSLVQKSLPRPPPLQKGPGMVASAPATLRHDEGEPGSSKQPARVGAAEASTEMDSTSRMIIRNVFNYLLTAKQRGGNMKDGIVFTSRNPDLVKLTSDIAGVDFLTVRDTLSGQVSQTVRNFVRGASVSNNISRIPTTNRNRSHIGGGPQNLSVVTKRCNPQIFLNLESPKRFRASVTSDEANSNYRGWTPQTGMNSSADAYKKLANLPVDVTIKPEVSSYFSENDEDYAMDDYGDEDQDEEQYFEEHGTNGR